MARPRASHERSNKAWRESAPNKVKESPHQNSLQVWMLYAIRYITTGDLSDSRYTFGWISAQLNRLSIVLQIAVAEIASLAIAYDYELRMHI